MPSYTVKSKLESRLPPDLPDDITDADFAEWIEDASKEVDGEVGVNFPVLDSGSKFEDYPDTPFQIQLCAYWLAMSNALERLQEIQQIGAELDDEDTYRKRAMDKLTKIRRGDIDVFGADGEDAATDTPLGIAVEARTQIFTATELAKF